jgi:hypothetical protein
MQNCERTNSSYGAKSHERVRNNASAIARETKNSGAQRKKRRQARSQKTKQPMHMQTHEQERTRARKSLRAQ